MKRTVVYVHGKGGNAAEAEHYIPLFGGCDVIGFDYHAATPWEAADEFSRFFAMRRAECDHLTLIANSIGAFFSMSALDGRLVDDAYFISPIVNMERLICDMLRWAGETEQALEQKSEIATNFGETLSWRYLCYVREHPIAWRVPTRILYGERDRLTSLETVSAFAAQHAAELAVMEQGEHWFHTPEQMRFLDGWISRGEEKYK